MADLVTCVNQSRGSLVFLGVRSSFAARYFDGGVFEFGYEFDVALRERTLVDAVANLGQQLQEGRVALVFLHASHLSGL
jgi:hypothetical protein